MRWIFFYWRRRSRLTNFFISLWFLIFYDSDLNRIFEVNVIFVIWVVNIFVSFLIFSFQEFFYFCIYLLLSIYIIKKKREKKKIVHLIFELLIWWIRRKKKGNTVSVDSISDLLCFLFFFDFWQVMNVIIINKLWHQFRYGGYIKNIPKEIRLTD